MGGRSGQSINNGGGNVNSISNVESRIRTQDFESAAAYDKDGKQLWFKDGSKSSVQMTNEELLQAKGNVFTHNHPSGNSFSLADVLLLLRHELGEMRAIGSGYHKESNTKLIKYDYSLKNPNNIKLTEKLSTKIITEITRAQIRASDKAYKNTNNESEFRQYLQKEYIKNHIEIFKKFKLEYTATEIN